MLKRLVQMLRSERALAPEIRLQLIDGLFYPFASLIAGALAGIWIAATVTILAEDMVVEFVADFAVVVAVLRIIIGLRYTSLGRPADKTNARFWEIAYATGGGLFAFSLGMLCLLAVTLRDLAQMRFWQRDQPT